MDSVNDIATVVGLIRDFALLLLMVVALVAFLIILRKAVGLINTAKRTADKAEQIIDLVSERVVQPAASNPRLLRALGRAVGFLAGLLSRRRRQGGGNDGQQ